jgi:1,6-anhydro-N-acetylmuramate kinase
MTGTSLDGLDAALVEVRGRGLELRAALHGMVSHTLGDLTQTLRNFATGGQATALDYARAARRLGELHAQAIADLCTQRLGSHDLDLVVAHGQTIWHAPPPLTSRDLEKGATGHPSSGGPCSYDPKHGSAQMPARGTRIGQRDREAAAAAGLSWQLFDPWPVVRRLRVPVCYDLRQADLIAGGQGAPISPLADWVLYRDPAHTRVVVNLGGICNLTILPAGAAPDAIDGYDAGPCNLLIDGVVRALFPGQTFDRDGALAGSGEAGGCFREALHAHPWWQQRSAQTGRRRSTGREDFDDAWLHEVIARQCADMRPQDVVASAVGAVAGLVADAARAGGAQQIILAGGGSHNRALVAGIGRLAAGWAQVLRSDDLGIPVAAREAVAFAVLGALSQDGVPITLPRVTGANQPGRAGAWVYP